MTLTPTAPIGRSSRRRRRHPQLNRVRRQRPIDLELLEVRRLLSGTDVAADSSPAVFAEIDPASPQDFGDAPFPYPTSRNDNGAVHLLVSDLWLGMHVDAEADGVGNWGASGDDFDNSGDENGIAFTSPLLPGQAATLTAQSSRGGRLQGWIDFNADGDWNDAGEQILRDHRVQSGMNTLYFVVPAQAPPGVTYARFRISDQVGIGPTGSAVGGEVEDYVLLVGSDTSEIPPPIARDDHLTVLENSRDNRLDVLANDALPLSGGRITHLDAAGVRGTVSLGPGGGSLIYAPPLRFVGSETLQYTATNLVGESHTATTIIQIQDEVKPPLVEDDQYVFTTNSGQRTLQVLNNDLSENGTLRIISVSEPSAGGAAAVSSDGKALHYIPSVDYSGNEELYYVVQDVSGLTAEGHVHLDIVGSDKHLRIRLATTDSIGQPVTNVRPGEKLALQVLVQDLRPTGRGIFAAYVDVEYDDTRLTTDGPLAHGPSYSHATSGDTSLPGQIDEAGGTDGVRPLGRSEFLLFEVPLRAAQTGPITLTANAADLSPIHDVLVFASSRAVDPELIEFGSVTLQVVEFTNPQLPNDVDGNQVVSPIDALLVINDLNASGPRALSHDMALDAIPQYSVDTNGDGFLSPVDALQVINSLNQVQLQDSVTVVEQDSTISPLPSSDLLSQAGSDERDSDREDLSEEAPATDAPTQAAVDLRPTDIVAIESLFASYAGSQQQESLTGDALADDLLGLAS